MSAILPLKRTAIVKETKWLKSGRLFIAQKSNQNRSTVMAANLRDESFFIVKICARFANVAYQKALIVAQPVRSICVKPYQHSLNSHLKQVKLWSNFVSRKYEQGNPADLLLSLLISVLGI